MIKNFKWRFVVPICGRVKRSTIRKDSPRSNLKVGQTLHAYTGPRMAPVKIGEGKCLFACRIEMAFGKDGMDFNFLTSEQLPEQDAFTTAHAFARMEGFANYPELRAFFIANHEGAEVFHGWFAYWGFTFEKDAAFDLFQYGGPPCL